MTGIIDAVASIIVDLMGCTEDDAECVKKARKMAAWIVYGLLLIVILLVGAKAYSFFKGEKK